MTVQRSPVSRVRFPLFWKMLSGFVLIITFGIFSSMFLLSQLREVFSSGIVEFGVSDNGINLSQQLDKTLDDEMESLRIFIGNRSEENFKQYEVYQKKFVNLADSLASVSEREGVRLQKYRISTYHAKLSEIVEQGTKELQRDSSYNLSQEGKQASLYADSLRVSIQSLYDSFRSSMSKSFRLFEKRTSIALDGAWLVLTLTLTIALVAAIVLTRTVIKPIQALKEGTKEVGEGHYETVTVTTNDEISDLSQAFNSMSEKLKRLDELRMQMMSEISHEMRTPLQVIKAACHMLVHSKTAAPMNEKQVQSVSMIHQAANRINSFVNTFLDIAKMESGLMTFNFEKSDINECIQPLVAEAQLIGQARQVKVEYVTNEFPELALDKDRLTQAVSNLFSNALKFTPEGGSVTIRLAKTEREQNNGAPGKQYVRLDVQDTGVGIPPDDLKKLFTKFFQAKNTPLVKEKGSGLGLALVKHVAEAHGGRVGVASEVGKGSTFSIFLPLP
jgi:signal transduction histidine kinase